MGGESSYSELLVAHHVGDYLLQTDHQARTKADGLTEDGDARRALAVHGLTYTLAFAPILLRVARRHGRGRALALAAVIGLPHVAVDDGRLLRAFMRRVKGLDPSADPALTAQVDQSMHLACLWAAARLAER